MIIPQNELDDAATRASRRFPDHQVDVPFRVSLPVYELRLKVTEITEDDLSTPARFVLQLSNLDVTQPAQIGQFLGMPQNYVAGAAAELLGKGLVTQSPALSIGITDSGKQALRDGGRTRRPRNKHIRIPYDPLTKRVLDIEIDQLLGRDEVRKNGLFVPHTGPRRPRLSNIRIDEVRDYERFNGQRGEKTEILDVSDIKDVRLKYRNDVILVKLDSPNSRESLFAAYRAQQYLEDESASMQRLSDRGGDLVPEELKLEPSLIPWTQLQSASPEESMLLEEIEVLDRDVGRVERAVAEAEAVRGNTSDAEERVKFEARIETLESEKLDLENKLGKRESELREVAQGQLRLIKTEEHRQLLLSAIENVTSELTLVSAWIDPFAFDDEICRTLAAAISRGARVRIAWGLGVRKRGPEATRNREKGNTALEKLKRLIPGNLAENLTVKLTDTHEKFIICDDQFCAWGSFNWLSYRGMRDSAYRRETSSYSERHDDIVLWKANADELFR